MTSSTTSCPPWARTAATAAALLVIFLAVTADARAVRGHRVVRHLSKLADFENVDPLSVRVDAALEGAQLYHRQPRGAPCDCADNNDHPDLMGEFVNTAPVVDGNEYVVEQHVAPQLACEFVEAPEERAGVVLSEADDPLCDDQEATLSEVGLHPVDEAPFQDGEPCEVGRPARKAEQDATAEEAEKAEATEASETKAEAEAEAATAN